MAKKHANIALGYIRLSRSINPDEENSPERQRANIISTCERYGWDCELYEDVGGHKSGTSEEGRHEWLKLKKRLEDNDVVALVANDMSRLHRKGWRVSHLIEHLQKIDVALVLAAPGREIDTTTAQGRMFAQFTAIIDEYYATDVSIRAKDSIAYRKSQGKTVGMPPFGTKRDNNGFLIPSNEGAWLLSSGRFIAGIEDEVPPAFDAIWISYYLSAERALNLYANGDIGLNKLSYQLNEEGWAYRTRKGKPRSFKSSDIRRIVANWAEYGGLSLDNKATARPAYEEDYAEYELSPNRAVFSIDLLLRVAEVRSERSIKPRNNGVNRKVRAYPLAGVTYYAHCEKIASNNSDASYKTRLSGAFQKIKRYRHKPGVSCGVTNRSVPATEYEADFKRLLELLVVDTGSMDYMVEMAIQAEKQFGKAKEDKKSLEEQKIEAVAKCNLRIDNARMVFMDGDISRDEYISIREQNEREIAHWQTRTTETEKLALELMMCMDAVDKIARLWDMSSDEDRRGLVDSLFEFIVFDLDTRRITDFRLKSWADRFLVLRTALYIEEENKKPANQDGCTPMLHTGLEPVFSP